MSIFSRFLRRREPTKADQPAPDFLRATANSLRYQPPDYSLADNQLKSYQAMSWIAIANGAVADGCVAHKLNVMRLVGEEKEQVDNHDFEQLIRRPNPLQSRYTFLFATVVNYRLAGNAYLWMNRPSGGPPVEIYSLPPNRMRPITGDQVGLVTHYEWDAGTGTPYKIPPEDVVHIKGYHPRDMFVGMSRVEPVAIQLEKDHKAQKYDLSFYADDFAKPEGIFGVKGEVDKAYWEEFKAFFKREYGGTKRGLALIRDIADFDYIQTALNYLDMEFLANRNFTKEEIFATFAPGLASVLAVNATEANSQEGKATLAEFAIYPVLIALQEAFTNHIMPWYGDNLICEFEDPRLRDRAMELQEINEFAKYHTINEVRAEYYQDKPIDGGDVLTGHSIDDAEEKDRRDLLAKIGVIKAAAETGIEEVIIAALLQTGFSGDYQKPAVPPQLNSDNDEQADNVLEDDAEDEPPVKARIIEVQPTKAQMVRDELRAWKRFESRRWGKENPRPFETEHIPDDLAEVVRDELNGAKAIDDLEVIFAKAQETADNPEPPKLNWKLDPTERVGDSSYVPPITEADIEAASVMETLTRVLGEEKAKQAVEAELGHASD